MIGYRLSKSKIRTTHVQVKRIEKNLSTSFFQTEELKSPCQLRSATQSVGNLCREDSMGMGWPVSEGAGTTGAFAPWAYLRVVMPRFPREKSYAGRMVGRNRSAVGDDAGAEAFDRHCADRSFRTPPRPAPPGGRRSNARTGPIQPARRCLPPNERPARRPSPYRTRAGGSAP